ncbi:HEAT repeat domain-containing protein [Nitrospira sp. Kam-Ns4a]
MGGRVAVVRWGAAAMLAGCLAWPAGAAEPGERALTAEERQLLDGKTTLYVDVRVSTWMPRGRTLFDAEATVHRKLAAAGLKAVRNPTDPHDLVLLVDYREERGKEFSFDNYGTDIVCRVRLEHPILGLLLDLTIRESSPEPETGTPPYLEALARFEANPYFYLLGNIVHGRLVSHLDQTGALIQALERLIDFDPSKLDHPQDGHTMAPNEILYLGQARENTIRELGRLKEPRAVPVLDRLLQHADPRVRLSSVEALRAIPGPEAGAALERVARQDQAGDVRAAAASALAARLADPPTP